MNARIQTIVLLLVICGLSDGSFGSDIAQVSDRGQSTRIGAVAYAPGTVSVFQGLTRYLNKNGLPSDYVLYSSYDALVSALDRGEVDIAWNTPLAHAQFHVRNKCKSQTLVMRDVDFNVRSTLIVRAESEVRTLADLTGKQLVLGSTQAAEATVLPLYFLRNEGVDFSKVEIVSLDAEVDGEGNPCASPEHVLRALRDGRGDAGIITVDLWNRESDQSSINGEMRQVWTSPPFSHCVFTAAAAFNKDLAARFTKLMTEMDPEEPATLEVMQLEGTKRWLPGSPDGFVKLVEAIRDQ